MLIASTVLQIIGGLGLLLYGMKALSESIQKSASDGLHKALGFMTGNRFSGMLTGLLVTMIIQSSGATTAMTVSFVNAGLMTLNQAIGVIFGANIGTTVTAWIVTLLGFSFNLNAFAVPIFGIGFFISRIKILNKKGLGEAVMGFGLLFIGLGCLTEAMPSIDAESVEFLRYLTDKGALGLLAGVLAGLLLTVLLHSSSASTAIILTLVYKNILTWEFSAAMVLGSNIGSTIDALLVAIGARVNARRTAFVHVFFNVFGTIIAMIFFKPFLRLVDAIVPGTVAENFTAHVATLHTLFNVINALIFLPFVNQIAALATRLIKPKDGEQPDRYRLDFVSSGIKDSVEINVIRATKEIADMTTLVFKMFDGFICSLENRDPENVSKIDDELKAAEEYADQMQEILSGFLVKCSQMPTNERTRNNISIMLRIVEDLENMSDECCGLVLLIKRSIVKRMEFDKRDLDRLKPYVELVQQFLNFVHDRINAHLTEEELLCAQELEDRIDRFRKNLKKVARKRLEAGADVRAELLYIDLVRHIEKIGDYAFSISESLAQSA